MVFIQNKKKVIKNNDENMFNGINKDSFKSKRRRSEIVFVNLSNYVTNPSDIIN